MAIPKVTDGELPILRLLWEEGELSAAEIVKRLQVSKHWNRNTTYTFLNRLVEKGIIARREPNFLCRALYTQSEVQVSEAKTFLEKMFDGSVSRLVASFMEEESVSAEDLDQLRSIVREKDGER